MIGSFLTRTAAGRLASRLPIFKLLAVAEIALLAKRHVGHLTRDERRRLGALVRRGRSLTPGEKTELRGLVAKLDARAFAGGAADRLSPIPLPRRMTGARY